MLPIISTSSSDLYRLYLQAKHEFVRSLGESYELDFGSIVINPSLSDLPRANHIRNAHVPAGRTAADVIHEADAFFATQSSRCHFYVTQDSALIKELKNLSWREETIEICLLKDHRSLPLILPENVKVFPARASFQHAAQILDQPRLAHLDDPRFELLLAFRDGKTIGSAGLFILGEVGLINEVKVIDESKLQGFATALMAHILDLAARSQLKHIMLDVAPDNLPAKSLYQKLGFQKLCDHTTYRAR